MTAPISAPNPVDLCPKCLGAVDASSANCGSCFRALAPPNVRFSLRSEDKAAVDLRYENSRKRHSAANLLHEIDGYEAYVGANSMAVINRTPLSLYAALSSQSDISGNFYTQRKARTRIYGSDEFNQLRELVDQAVFPGFHELIRHAALATDDRGLTSYGSCSIWLKAEAIDERASVFDSNTLVWVMKRDPPLSQLFKIEPGHRAPWEDRDRLAVSKLDSGPLLDPSSSFDEILLRQGSNSADDDFVEVHIWEMLTTDSVERFTLPLHPVPDEVAPVAALRELLIQRGLPFEELP